MKSDDKRARLILERWVAELSTKDRSKNSLSNNFEELFYDMFKASIPFDTAHSLLKEAIGHHFPSASVAKYTFKNVQQKPGQTFGEFLDGWKKLITDEATQAFYSFYQVEGENQEIEKKFGSMSAQEYSKQRKYAEAFPVIDTDALQKKIDQMLKDDDGGDNE